jgi:hypothetical protein
VSVVEERLRGFRHVLKRTLPQVTRHLTYDLTAPCKTVGSALALKQNEPAAGRQGVGVVGFQDTQPGVEDLPVFGLGLSV